METPIQVYYFFHLPSMWHNKEMFGLVKLCINLVFISKVWWNGDFLNKMDYLFRRNTLISFCRGIVSINSVVQGLLVESSVHNINLTHTTYLKFYIHSGKCKYEQLMKVYHRLFVLVCIVVSFKNSFNRIQLLFHSHRVLVISCPLPQKAAFLWFL